MGVVYFSIIPTFEPSRYCKCWIVCFYNIPVLVLLGVMTKATYTIKQYICDKLDIGVDICESLLEEGKINLFLDGLNEIPADAGGNLKTLRMREIKPVSYTHLTLPTKA